MTLGNNVTSTEQVTHCSGLRVVVDEFYSLRDYDAK